MTAHTERKAEWRPKTDREKLADAENLLLWVITTRDGLDDARCKDHIRSFLAGEYDGTSTSLKSGRAE